MSDDETPVGTSVVPTMPGRNGGKLQRGSLKGKAPSGGRPKDEVRAKLAKLANGKGMAFLKSLLNEAVCEKCGEDMAITLDHRLKGLDLALRYGVGTKDEVDIKSHPEVQRFMGQLAQATRELFGDEGYQRLSDRILEIAA